LKIIDKPMIMGILNLSPDSFYRASAMQGVADDESSLISRVRDMLPYCDLIDLGAVSTRPGSKGIPAEEEKARLMPALRLLQREFPGLYLSVDTWRAEVASMAVAEGAVMINDISGGTMDAAMFSTIAALDVPYVLMHMQGTPEIMQKKPVYKDVVNDIKLFFARKAEELHNYGVHDIILDPGFGFGKTIEHNFSLLQNLQSFRVFGLPLLVGLSRKSFIQKTLGVSAEEALNGTTVLNTLAVLNGADILRVHDVREAREVVALLCGSAEG